MQTYHYWLIAGLALCTVEMLVGTFFLLVLGIAALAGGITGWLGGGFWLQACVASLLAVVGVILVHNYRRRSAHAPAMASFDVGQPVTFEQWVSQNEGMARVNYRGTTWDALVSSSQPPTPGSILYIQAVEGSLLRLSDVKPCVSTNQGRK